MSVSIVNIRPHAIVAKTGMAMREGRRQRLSAIEQVEPPDHPLPWASPMKMTDNAARPTARAIAELPRVRMIETRRNYRVTLQWNLESNLSRILLRMRRFPVWN